MRVLIACAITGSLFLNLSCARPARRASGQRAWHTEAALRIYLSPSAKPDGRVLPEVHGGPSTRVPPNVSFAFGPRGEAILSIRNSEGQEIVSLNARGERAGDTWRVEGRLSCDRPVAFGIRGATAVEILMDGEPMESGAMVPPGKHSLHVTARIIAED